MKIKAVDVEGVVVMKLAGELTIGGGDTQLRDAFTGMLAIGNRNIILDMSEVEKIDASGIGQVVTCKTQADRESAELAIVGVGGEARRVLEITQLIEIFEEYSSLEEALEHRGVSDISRKYATRTSDEGEVRMPPLIPVAPSGAQPDRENDRGLIPERRAGTFTGSDEAGGCSVFLSYAREDLERVRPIYELLVEHGHLPWLDEREIVPGQTWRIQIEKAIGACDFFIACLSKLSISKEGFVQRELKIALEEYDDKPEEAIYLIPLRLEECTVPHRFRSLQWCDFFAENGSTNLLKAIEAGEQERALRNEA